MYSSADQEEKDQCEKMHSIIQEYGLRRDFGWLVASKGCYNTILREQAEKTVLYSDIELLM